ncbi:hypothetical protein C5167_026924 [Papaver somniferum]|nr:hypothetical protein C5167_026924 [Papaver somniferum]
MVFRILTNLVVIGGGGSGGGGGRSKEVKKKTSLGLSNKRDENFGDWYSEVVVRSEILEYYDISGLYILLPWSMDIWNIMKTLFDADIKKMEVKDCKFPLFVSEASLHKEEDHIDGFASEVAWVTK